MRSYFFSADTQEDMLGWVRALSQSAAMESNSSLNRWKPIHFAWNIHTKYQAFFHDWAYFLLPIWSFQALLKLSGLHTHRWQHWISGFPKNPLWWRGPLPETQERQQDSERTEPPRWWEDGGVALRAEGEAECASEEQQVVKRHTFKSQWFTLR